MDAWHVVCVGRIGWRVHSLEHLRHRQAVRRAHYLKANESGKRPERLLIFDCETEESMRAFKVSHHRLTFGWCAYTRRWQGEEWTIPKWFRFTSQDDFYAILLSLTVKDHPLTIVAHNLEYDVASTGLLDVMAGERWSLWPCVIASPPTFMTWRKGAYAIKALDSFNYFPFSLATLGAALGLPKGVLPALSASQDVWDTYCKRDVEILLRSMQTWYTLIATEDLGSAGVSLPSQAFHAFRHRFMTHKILMDDNERAQDISRQSYCGGRVSCFAIGEYHGQFYKVDINSMYPYVMREHQYPRILRSVWSGVSKDTLRKLLQTHCVSAYVRLNTPIAAYPFRTTERLLFPTGQFFTYLNTPELIYGLEHNHIVECVMAAIYDSAPLFVDYVNYFYAQRLAAKEANNEMMQLMYKLFLNSLYGKFGQTGHVTRKLDYDPGWPDLVHREVDGVKGVNYYWRKIGDEWWLDERHDVAADSQPTIAAHVTAYARMYLWQMIEQVGVEHCYYSDTDSLIVDAVGLDRLTGTLDSIRLGALKIEGADDKVTIHAPKHYDFDGERKMKGVRKDAIWLDSTTVRQMSCRSLKGLLKAGDTSHPQWVEVTKHIDVTYRQGVILPGGRTRPYDFPTESAGLDGTG